MSDTKVLIMLDPHGQITAVHTTDFVQVLAIQSVSLGRGFAPKYVGQAPAGMSGHYAVHRGFDNLVRQYFVNRVFKLFGR